MLALALPAHAHDGHEIEAWLEDWNARIPPQGLAVDDPMVAELADFKERHAWYFAPVTEAAFIPNRQSWPQAVEQWRPLVAGHFNPEDVETALCIIWHESRGDPNAKNPNSSASGLFQLLKQWHDHYAIDPFIPEQNVYAASALFYEPWGGWSHWNPYNQGQCRGL